MQRGDSAQGWALKEMVLECCDYGSGQVFFLGFILANPPGLWGCYAVSPVPLGSSLKEISPESSQ